MSSPESPRVVAPSSALATIALVAGIVSLLAAVVFVFVPAAAMGVVIFSIVAGLVAVVLGIVALARRQCRWMAVTGLVLGLLVGLAGLALLVFALLFVGALSAPV